MIDFQEYVKEFSFMKEDPMQKRTQEMCKGLLLQINQTIKELYEKETGKQISNYPTDDMIKFTCTNELSTLHMSNILSLVYDESSNCFIFSDSLYDEHQRGVKNDKDFNALILWTRIFSKENMIGLKEHNQEKKYLAYEVLDNRIVKNIIEYNDVDLKEMKEVLDKTNLSADIKKIYEKYDENFVKSKSEKELLDIAEKDCHYLIQNMMTQISSIMNGFSNGKQ